MKAKKEIKYIGFYSDGKDRLPRPIAAMDKVDYVCSAFENAGYSVQLISMSNLSLSKKHTHFSKPFLKEGRIIYPKTLLLNNFFARLYNKLFGHLIFKKILDKNISNGDVVVVYHSMAYLEEIIKLKKRKNITLILELEEIYSKIAASKKKNIKNEKELIDISDGFVFSVNSLNKKFNSTNKPGVVINGVYSMARLKAEHKESNRIRIVYAGSYEKQKGVDNVIKLSQFLPENYEIHLVGFGNASDLERIQKLISQIDNSSGCHLYLDGEKTGDEYSAFLSSCDIGICLQDPADSFNAYEFPSKIFSYLSHGLHVVCSKIEQLVDTDVYSYISIVDTGDIRKAANQIINIDLDKAEKSTSVLNELNKKTIKRINKMMEEL